MESENEKRKDPEKVESENEKRKDPISVNIRKDKIVIPPLSKNIDMSKINHNLPVKNSTIGRNEDKNENEDDVDEKLVLLSEDKKDFKIPSPKSPKKPELSKEDIRQKNYLEKIKRLRERGIIIKNKSDKKNKQRKLTKRKLDKKKLEEKDDKEERKEIGFTFFDDAKSIITEF